MKVSYRGFEIEASRDKCLAGHDLIYYSIFRESDKWEMSSNFIDTADTVRTMVNCCKGMVDDYLDNSSKHQNEDEDELEELA